MGGRASNDVPGPPPAGAERLLALPPERFGAERDALAKRLGADGDTAAAAAVRRLRRPVGLAWLLNRVAQERPEELEELLAAGDRVRSAQRRAMAGGGGEGLREADERLRGVARTLRAAARELAGEAGRAPPAAALARVELLLRMVSGAPGEVRDALRRGVLAREPEIVAGDLSGLELVAATPAAGARARGAVGKERPRRGERDGAASSRREDEARPRREDERRARREAAARAKAERAERLRAERAALDRRRRRAAAERSLAAAERAAEKARRGLEAAARRVDSARAALRALEGEKPG